MRIDRRQLVQGSAALAAGALLQRLASAAQPTPSTAAALYRRVLVIDCNLSPPLDDEKPLDAATVAAVRASGLTALKMTIGGSVANYRDTRAELDGIGKAIARAADVYLQIRTVGDFAVAKKSGRVGIIYSFEAADMLEGTLSRIDEFAALGVRVMQLSYNKGSPFGSGVLSPATGSGLTPLGRDAVARMNAHGVTLDLSHSDEPTTMQALAASKKPALISHAGCAAVHAHPRNKTDAALRALATRGGTVGIYQLCFLSAGPGQPVLDDYLAHLTHALSVCGEDHVGIGSDASLMPFDTSPNSIAEWNQDIATRKANGVSAPGEGPLPFVVGLSRPDHGEVIAAELLKRGYSARVTEKVLGANMKRVFAESW